MQMSGNMVSTFEAVDALKPLGGLTCLHLEHNPLYKSKKRHGPLAVRG